MASPDHMIRPLPRYFELYQRRAHGKNTAQEALRRTRVEHPEAAAVQPGDRGIHVAQRDLPLQYPPGQEGRALPPGQALLRNSTRLAHFMTYRSRKSPRSSRPAQIAAFPD